MEKARIHVENGAYFHVGTVVGIEDSVSRIITGYELDFGYMTIKDTKVQQFMDFDPNAEDEMDIFILFQPLDGEIVVELHLRKRLQFSLGFPLNSLNALIE